MDISLLFKFPGILILIGVVLLILAIIIGIIAYKTPVEDELDDTDDDDKNTEVFVNESVNNETILNEVPSSIEVEKDTNNQTIPMASEVIEKTETIVADNADLENEEKDPTLIDIKQNIKEEPASKEVIMTEQENQPAPIETINAATSEELKPIEFEKPKVETISNEGNTANNDEALKETSFSEFKFSDFEKPKETFESIIENENVVSSTLDDEKPVVESILDDNREIVNPFTENVSAIEEKSEPAFSFENVEEKKPSPFDQLREEDSKRVIYGGQKPLDHVDLSFDDGSQKMPYSEKINQEEVVPRLIIEDEPTDKNEDVELL